MDFRYLFGPVPSRRLGRSLGVDAVPYKTCTFDCVYCQLGATTRKTIERRAYIPAHDILEELDRWIGEGGAADYITLSGSGEPTLNSEAGEIVRGARSLRGGVPVAVLTNGSLLWDQRVREELAAADVIIPSLDAATPQTFQRVNRPAPELDIGRIIQGLRAAREELEGEMWLEIMVVRGFNDGEEEVEALREAVEYIKPARVQLNTVVRPPAEAAAEPVGRSELDTIASALGDVAEVIAPLPEGFEEALDIGHDEEEVLALLRRRPCTLEDVAAGLGMHPNEAGKYIAALIEHGRARRLGREGRLFYVAVDAGERKRADRN